MILDTIEAINERIKAQFSTVAIQIEGVAMPFYDQQELAQSLLLMGTPKRLVMDSRYQMQTAHLYDGSTVIGEKTWGSLTQHFHEVRFILIGLSRNPMAMAQAVKALRDTSYVVYDSCENDTLTVLTRYWRVKTNQDKNYDPDLYAFAMRYHLTGITDEDFAELDFTLVELVPAPANSGFPYTLPLTLY